MKAQPHLFPNSLLGNAPRRRNVNRVPFNSFLMQQCLAKTDNYKFTYLAILKFIFRISLNMHSQRLFVFNNQLYRHLPRGRLNTIYKYRISLSF